MILYILYSKNQDNYSLAGSLFKSLKIDVINIFIYSLDCWQICELVD
jgi:hypothetical protein